MSDYTDIIVIGAGPAGLAFARQFKNSPLTVTIIDTCTLSTLATPPFDGREIALTHFTKNFLQKCEILDLIEQDKIYSIKEAKVINGNSDYKLHFRQPMYAQGQPINNLGFLISNHDIRKACYESIINLANINLLNEIAVDAIQINDCEVIAKLSNGQKLRAQLIICADGRFSSTRQKIGIPTDIHQFGRNVICFRMQHELSNEYTAYEYFHYGHTLAILPLGEYLSSMVITVDANLADHILTMSPEELSHDMYRITRGLLGHFSLASKINTYPLVGVHARRFYTQRCALVGDCAVAMHPVTAHGFNLSIEGVAHLSKLIIEANLSGKDIANETLLERYNLKHQAKTRILYHGTNFIVKLFTNDTKSAKLIRKTILRISNRLNPVKQLIAKQLTG